MKIDIEKRKIAANWFKELRDKICNKFEEIETEFLEKARISKILDSEKGIELSQDKNKLKFERTNWKKQASNTNEVDSNADDFGGGEISIMRGNIFEKVGVNFSEVNGYFSDEFRNSIPGTKDNPEFWASGISLVAHMRSPHVPAVHMNTRFICTDKCWFGGGADLNPIFEALNDTEDFHSSFKNACDKYDENYYTKFKKNCDEYFFIKHRNIPRGVGGIFYDYLNINSENYNFEQDFNFTKDVGLAFLDIYPKIVVRNMLKSWTIEERETQLKKRGYYTEFNLVYDRGTKFGLMTGGNTEAILMSLPPVAKW